MHRLRAEGTRLIEVGAMAGMGKTATLHAGGAPVAAQPGAFGESLKASVAAGAEHGAVASTSMIAGVPVPVAGGAGAAGRSGLTGGVSAIAKGVADASAGKGLEAEVHEVAQPEVAKDRMAAVAKGAEVGGIGGTAKRVEVKSAKPDAVAGEKKAVAKDGESAVSVPVVQDGAVGVVGVASVTMPVTVAVPVDGSAAGPGSVAMTSMKEAGPGELAAVAVGGTGKGGKVQGANGAGKPVAREAKKVDGSVAADSTPGVAGVHAVGSGARPGGGKDATAAAVVQGGVGGVAVAPVGAVGSHAGVVGVAGARVAASVDGVAQSGGQANAQGNASGEVKTLAATPNLLEVGIESGTHGWLRVRAEMGQTGEVTASMVAASAGQADTLRRELPAMSTYLAGESVGVSSLVVNAAGAAGGAQDAAMSLGTGAQGGGDGRAQGSGFGAQSGGQGGAAGANGGGVSGLEFGGEELPAAVYANGSGNWVSVRV